MLGSLLTEIGKSSRTYSELAGRSEPLPADVILSLINAGIRINELEPYAKRQNKTTIPAPVPSIQPKQLSILQAGTKAPHPSYIPAHLPMFPDPHAYIRTPTHKQPVTEYEAIREKSAVQKRDIERALNKFATRTSETDSLFLCQDNLFPLIACKATPNVPAYLVSLLPKDQVFEQDEEQEYARAPSPPRQQPQQRQQQQQQQQEQSPQQQRKRTSLAGKELMEESQKEMEIDSPFLLPAKLPPPKIKIKDLLAPSHQGLASSSIVGPGLPPPPSTSSSVVM
ncbi:Transcription factor TFIID complex subunit 8 C-term [Nesidiocoris tenuis]|nr:Transcription factor TFIID complex subunit 8 C-term [Nesidiocoris tenuis]